MNKKIGLLLPKSVLYPTINFDLVAGARYALIDSGIEAEIKTESIGLGADNKLIYAACEKLIFDGCSIIAGYVNPASAEQLEPLFANANAIFLALDAGYHYPTSVSKLPHVFYISLQGALCCRITAKNAMAEGKKNFAFTGSFYDAGYRSYHAYGRCLGDEGGNITFNLITPLKRSEFTLETLSRHLQEPAADAILASFCGDMMQDFCAAAANGRVFENHPVYGTPFMGEEQWLEQSVYPGTDIKTTVPWASKLDNAANKHFIKTLTENKQRTNVFSVLGWEAGLVAAAAMKAGDTDSAIQTIEGMQYNSPRGGVRMDAVTHNACAPVYEAVIRKNEHGDNCVLELVKESPYTEQQRKKLEGDIIDFNGNGTSWFNAYACLES